jgi:hypothetical protein
MTAPVLFVAFADRKPAPFGVPLNGWHQRFSDPGRTLAS